MCTQQLGRALGEALAVVQRELSIACDHQVSLICAHA